MAKLPPFDKYEYYLKSVQAPDIDSKFFFDMYKELNSGRTPVTMREDFCGAAALSCEWVKLSKKNRAIGIDLDLEPIEWGKKHLLPQMSTGEQERIELLNKNVLDKNLPLADVVAAQNFSFFLFKERNRLKEYFQNSYNTLHPNGLFITDVFGGGACTEPNEEETKYRTYSYYWDQDTFNPITNEGVFYIHFKRKGERRREKVFVYDWRLWSITELRDLMSEVGFKKTYVYWEGTTKKGEGDGNFKVREVGDIAESWIAYVVGQKL